MQEDKYLEKYLKYKKKYLLLKNKVNGGAALGRVYTNSGSLRRTIDMKEQLKEIFKRWLTTTDRADKMLGNADSLFQPSFFKLLRNQYPQLEKIGIRTGFNARPSDGQIETFLKESNFGVLVQETWTESFEEYVRDNQKERFESAEGAEKATEDDKKVFERRTVAKFEHETIQNMIEYLVRNKENLKIRNPEGIRGFIEETESSVKNGTRPLEGFIEQNPNYPEYWRTALDRTANLGRDGALYARDVPQ